MSHPADTRSARVAATPPSHLAALRDGRVDYNAIKNAAQDSPDVLGRQLSSAWAAQYRQESHAKTELVEISLGSMTYLFDVAQGRTVGVYGQSAPNSDPRPESRIRGHPSYNRGGNQTDRGHLAAHTIGGGADLNLVAQDHALNISGSWRAFEREAQANPGTFFAVQVEYQGNSDYPSGFVYGIERDGQFEHQEFANG